MNEHSIFLAVLEIGDPAEQSAYLDIACAGAPDVRSHVEQLLKAHQDSGRLIDRPASERLATPGKLGETQDETPADDTDSEALEFLIPSDKPGVLGRLGRYEVLNVIGRGGMGVVLRAFDEQLHRMVAIKVMAAQLATNATARKRFRREARAAAAVCHDHIVTIHAVEEARDVPYLVMKYVDGLSLQQRLKREGPLQLREILRIGMETASGLAAAHARGLIHRDIKPANILLEGEPGASATGGRVKITDFGLARAADDSSLTQSGVVAGTPDYMSPEQARGETLDARTDLFSLGSVLYALCTGRPPFHADDTMAILHRVCEEAPTPIRESNPEIPRWLVAIIEKLHAKDPAQRFQSAAELAELLRRHLAQVLHPPVAPLPGSVAGAESSKPRPGAQTGASKTQPRPHRRRLAVAAAIVVLLLGGFALTEATGLTKFAATVIHAFTPDDTPVVEGDDPGGAAAIEGGGLVIAKTEPGWVQLFNGKDLAGWKPHPNWRVEEGIIIASGPTERNAFLVTERNDYQDFHLRVEVRILTEECDSGVLFRGSSDSCQEANIAFDPKKLDQQTGTLSLQKYKGGSWVGGRRFSAPPGLGKLNEWLTLEVIARGQHVITKVNGRTAVETYEAIGYRPSHILLQQHGAQTVVHFRKVEIKELVTTPDQAVELAEKAQASQPNNGVFLASLGTAYYRAGRWQDAIRTLLKADEVGHGADVSFSPFVLAMGHWQIGEKEQARKLYRLGQVWLARRGAAGQEQLRSQKEAADLLGLPESLSPEEEQVKDDGVKYFTLALEALPDAVWAWMHRASAFEQLKQWDKAAADYRRAVEIGEKRVTEPPLDAQRRRRLAYAHQELARVLLYHLSQPEEAARSRQRQVALYQQLVIDFPKHAADREQLGHSLRWLAFDFEKMQQPLQAETAFGQAIEHLEKFVDDFPDKPAHHSLLADTYDRLRQLLAANGKAKEAGEEFDKAIRVLAGFPAERATTPEVRASLADLHHRRGNLLREAQRIEEAASAYRQAIDVRGKLADEFPKERSHRQELGRNHNWLGVVLAQKGRTQEAEQAHRQAFNIYEKLAGETDPSASHWHRRELAWTCLNLGETLEKELKFDEAMELYRQAGALCENLAVEKSDSTYPYWGSQAYSKLARLLTGADRPNEANNVCRKLLELDPPPSGQSLNLTARHLITSADPKYRAPELAIELAQKAVEREPQATHILHTLGMAQYRAGDWKAAISTLMKSQEIGSQSFDSNAYFLAMAHWQRGEKEQARKWYGPALVWTEKGGSKEELIRFRAEAAALLGLSEQLSPEQEQARTDEVKLYTLVLEALPKVAWVYQHRGRAFGRAGQWDKAVADFSTAIELRPDYWLNWADRGWARRGLKQFDQATADYSKALDLVATVDWVWYQRGQSYSDLRQWDKALVDFSKAIELKPGDASYWNLRGVTHSRLGQKEKALADYVKASELNPKAPLYWSNRGSVNGQLGQHDKAVADYSKAIELKADEFSYWNNRGNAFAELGQWGKASADFVKTIELKEDDPLPRYRLAVVSLQQGAQDEYRKVCAGMLERFGQKADSDPAYWTVWTCVLGPDAVSDWKPVVDLAEKSLAADPKNCDKLQHLGAVLYRAGRFEEAAKCLTEAEAAFPEAKNPRSSITYNWLFQAMTQHRLGKAEEAKKWLDKAVEAIDQPPEKSKDANAGTWNRRLTLQLLRREAQTQLGKE